MESNFRGPYFRAVDELSPQELNDALHSALRRAVDAAELLDADVSYFDLQRGVTEFVEGLDVVSLGYFVATVPSVAAAELAGLAGVLVELARMRAVTGPPAHRVGTVERCLDCDRWGRAGHKLCHCDEDFAGAVAAGVWKE